MCTIIVYDCCILLLYVICQYVTVYDTLNLLYCPGQVVPGGADADDSASTEDPRCISLSLSLSIYIYICVYTCKCIHNIYIHV